MNSKKRQGVALREKVIISTQTLDLQIGGLPESKNDKNQGHDFLKKGSQKRLSNENHTIKKAGANLPSSAAPQPPL